MPYLWPPWQNMINDKTRTDYQHRVYMFANPLFDPRTKPKIILFLLEMAFWEKKKKRKKKIFMK